MKKKSYVLTLIVVLFIPVFTSPIKTEQNKPQSDNIQVLTNAGPPSRSFIYGTYGLPNTIDPIDCLDHRSERIIDQVAETLFTYDFSDPNLPLIPLLATSYTVTPDGLNYTINLRENVIFHDGTKFNATAAEWNFDRMEYWYNFTGALPSYESTAYPHYLFYFENAEISIWNHTEIVGEYIIKFVLNAPFLPFLDLLTCSATAMVSPTSHGWDITSPIATGFTKLPVGTGPFVIEYFNFSDREAKFHAFENYWRRKANIKEMIFSYYEDATQANIDLLAGTIHFIEDPAISYLPAFEAADNITVLDEGLTSTYSYAYQMFNNHLINQTWRQALSYAFNYTWIIEELFENTSKRLKSPVPDGILYANSSFNNPTCNITKAREIVQSMGFGFTDGVPWNTTYPGTDENLWTSASFASYSIWTLTGSGFYFLWYDMCSDWFDLIGVTLSYVETTYPVFFENFETDPDWIDMWITADYGYYNDPSYFINHLYSNSSVQNYGQVNDTYLQNLIDQGLIETNPQTREAIYDEIQRYMVEDLMPTAWLLIDKLRHAHHVNLTGFTQNIFNRIYFYYCRWIPPYISIISPENIVDAPLEGYYPATYGFDNDTSGGVPAKDWGHHLSSGCSINIVDSYKGHNKVYEIFDNNEYAASDVYHDFENQFYGTIEYWALGKSVGNWTDLYVLDRNVPAQIFRVDLTPGTYLSSWNGTGYDYHPFTEFGILNADEWYHIRVDFRSAGAVSYMGLSEDSFRVYLNGVPANTDLSFTTVSNSVNQFVFQSGYSAYGSEFYSYLDAVGFSWDPSYNVGDNLNEGMQLSFYNNTQLDWITYSLDGQANITIFDQEIIPLPADGPHTIQLFGKDTLSGDIVESEIRDFIVDTKNPVININSPSPNQLCGVTAPSFDVQIIESNLQEKGYSFNGRPNITFTTETQFNQTEWEEMSNGTVLIRFYAIDVLGNVNFTEVTVRKDAYIPDIIIHSPLDDQQFGKTAPNFNLTIIEEDLASTWYTIEGIAGTFPLPGLTGSIDQDAWDDAPEGEITITFYALDNAGNIGSEIVDVIKKIPSEPVIPGYNVFLVLGILSVVVILIWKKLKKS